MKNCRACQKDPLGVCDQCLGAMFLDGICIECGKRPNVKWGLCEDCHAKDQEEERSGYASFKRD